MDTDAIQQSFAPLIGMPAWLVQKGNASCITMEFGQPHLQVDRPILSSSVSEAVRRALAKRRVYPRGEWHLWIYCCHWRVLCGGDEIAWSESPDDEIIKAANEIDSLLFTKVTVDPVDWTSEFLFESDMIIQMWPYQGGNRPQWLLFMPSGDCLTYRADGLYSLGPSNRKPDEKIWLTLT